MARVVILFNNTSLYNMSATCLSRHFLNCHLDDELTFLRQPRPSRSLEDFLYSFIHRRELIELSLHDMAGAVEAKVQTISPHRATFLVEGTRGRSIVVSGHERSLYQLVYSFAVSNIIVVMILYIANTNNKSDSFRMSYFRLKEKKDRLRNYIYNKFFK